MSDLHVQIAMSVIWLALAVIFAVIEMSTVGLMTIWFAAGSLVALFLSLLKVPLLWQIIAFLGVSFCLLVFTRKIFVDKLKTGSEPTNTEALIGETATVTSKITPHSAGRAEIDGQDWAAVCRDDICIEKNSQVKVLAIEGVKLVVEPSGEESPCPGARGANVPDTEGRK